MGSFPRFAHVFTGLLFLSWTAPFHAAARKIMVMGDSQSEEYAFEAGPAPLFSGPDSDILNANIRNWIEILTEERPADCYFGPYDGDRFAYSDIRREGFAYNWSVPGAETGDMVDVLEATFFRNPQYLPSLGQITDQIQTEVAYVVIFLGANDVRSIYGDFYNNTVPSGFNSTLVANLKKAIDFVQSKKSSMRIVVVNIPDPGVTPSKIAAHPDPMKRAAASARLASLNQSIASMAAGEGCALADVMALTELIRAPGNFYLNGRHFLKAGHPENPPNYLFAKDGFHPSTVAQALFANAILKAINTKWSQNIPLLANREILGDVLDFNPDQPLLDWLAESGGSGGVWGNPDGDGDTNLQEFALGMEPAGADVAAQQLFFGNRSGQSSLVLQFPNASTQNGYLLITPQESLSPTGPWTNVPNNRIASLPGGGVECWRPSAGPRGFLRLAISPAP